MPNPLIEDLAVPLTLSTAATCYVLNADLTMNSSAIVFWAERLAEQAPDATKRDALAARVRARIAKDFPPSGPAATANSYRNHVLHCAFTQRQFGIEPSG